VYSGCAGSVGDRWGEVWALYNGQVLGCGAGLCRQSFVHEQAEMLVIFLGS
jgi:hypothetical protein